MSGVKHTPWEEVETESGVDLEGCSGWQDIADQSGRTVAIVIGWGGWSDADLDRNARLIAAAPDLLEALTEARLTLSLTRTNIMVEMKKSEGAAYRWEGVPELLANRIAQCDAAIARARGEQSPNHSDKKEVGNG